MPFGNMDTKTVVSIDCMRNETILDLTVHEDGCQVLTIYDQR